MDKTNSSWLKTFSIGFSIISFGITIAIVGYIVLTTKQNQTVNQQPTSISPTISQSSPNFKDKTANWKKYINEKYKYSLEYPSELSILNVSNNEEATIWDCSKEFQYEEYGGGCKGHPGYNYLYIKVYDKQNEILPSPYSCILEDSRTQQDTIQLAGRAWTHYQYTVDETVRKKYCATEPIPSDHNRLLITNLNNSIVLAIRISNASDNAYKLLNQILSTFRFTQ